MAWIDLQLRLSAGELDDWSDALLDAGAVSVSIEDEDVDTADEVPVYGEPGAAAPPGWKNNRVGVLLDSAADPLVWLGEVARSLGRPAPEVIGWRRLEDQDWVRQTQAQFETIRVGRIAVVPTWKEPPPDAACVIRLDPGIAFGTGSHPTTRLCLEWLERHLRPGQSVLDYGCGSGILAICAARLGAGDVAAVDIDVQALAVAAQNARANRAQVEFLESGDLDASRRFDIVVANILANPLVVLAPALLRRVAPGGVLLLSGVLERQRDEVAAAYLAASEGACRLETWRTHEGWAALVATV